MSRPPEEGHTVRRYDAELSHVSMSVLEMGGLVLDQTQTALRALRDQDLALARSVVDRDHCANELGVQIDEELVSVIARRGPLARDLRMVIALSKAVTDLERVGDEAAKIAGMILSLYGQSRSHPSTHLTRDIYVMGELAVGMLRQALEAYDTVDTEKAEVLAFGQSELDAEFQSALRRQATFILEDARTVGHVINTVLIVKSLERIGDHARNLAEYIVYMVKGQGVRHKLNEAKRLARGPQEEPGHDAREDDDGPA